MIVNRTRAAIAAAFLHLLETHTIEKITVQMITDEAGCSRKTFYYYFTDVYDLTRHICDEKVGGYLRSSTDAAGVREGFLELMRYLDTERPVILNLFHGYGKEELERFTWQATEHYTRKLISRSPDAQGVPPEDLESVICMYTYMLFGMMIDWIGNDMAGDYARTLDLSILALPTLLRTISRLSS